MRRNEYNKTDREFSDFAEFGDADYASEPREFETIREQQRVPESGPDAPPRAKSSRHNRLLTGFVAAIFASTMLLPKVMDAPSSDSSGAPAHYLYVGQIGTDFVEASAIAPGSECIVHLYNDFVSYEIELHEEKNSAVYFRDLKPGAIYTIALEGPGLLHWKTYDSQEIKLQMPEPPLQSGDPSGAPWLPTQPRPTDPQPTDPQPTDPQPTDPQPTNPQPTDPQPTDPQPTNPQPTDPQPTDPQQTEPTQPTETQPNDQPGPNDNPSNANASMTYSIYDNGVMVFPNYNEEDYPGGIKYVTITNYLGKQVRKDQEGYGMPCAVDLDELVIPNEGYGILTAELWYMSPTGERICMAFDNNLYIVYTGGDQP